MHQNTFGGQSVEDITALPTAELGGRTRREGRRAGAKERNNGRESWKGRTGSEITVGQRFTGRQFWMGHVGHGSLL